MDGIRFTAGLNNIDDRGNDSLADWDVLAIPVYVFMIYNILGNILNHLNGVCLRLVFGLHLLQLSTFGYREHLIASILI